MNRSKLIAELNHLQLNIGRIPREEVTRKTAAFQEFDNFLLRHGKEIVAEMSDMFSELAMNKLKKEQRRIKSQHEL